VMILVGFAVCGLELLGVWPAKQSESAAPQFSSAART